MVEPSSRDSWKCRPFSIFGLILIVVFSRTIYLWISVKLLDRFSGMLFLSLSTKHFNLNNEPTTIFWAVSLRSYINWVSYACLTRPCPSFFLRLFHNTLQLFLNISNIDRCMLPPESLSSFSILGGLMIRITLKSVYLFGNTT